MSVKTIVVTGGNKGVGFHTVRDLALDGRTEKVIFTYRKEADGEKAMEDLTTKHKVPKEKLDKHQLDITSSESIEAFYKFLKEKYGKIDVLLNNAGVLTRSNESSSEDTNYENAKPVFAVNHFGTLAVTQKLLDLVTSKVVTVASSAGLYMKFKKDEVRDKFYKAKDFSELDAAVNHFMEALKKGTQEGKVKEVLESEGYETKVWFVAYSVSKLCAIKSMKLLADQEKEGRIIVSICPGYILSDLNRHLDFGGMQLTPEDKGGENSFNVVMNSTKEYHGGFYRLSTERHDLF